MIANRQTGLMPSWPRGRGIAEIFGYLAAITIFVQIGGFVIGHLFPNLDPGEPQLFDLMLGLATASIFGLVWLALRAERLGLAQIAIAINGTGFASIIIWVAVRNMRSGTFLSGYEGLLLYGCGSFFVFCCWLAYREVQTERLRREARDA